MTTCDNCGGDGGFEVAECQPKWSDDPYGGKWVECRPCHGSGWIDDEPPALDDIDLDERCGP